VIYGVGRKHGVDATVDVASVDLFGGLLLGSDVLFI